MYQVVLCGYHNWHFETFHTPESHWLIWHLFPHSFWTFDKGHQTPGWCQLTPFNLNSLKRSVSSSQIACRSSPHGSLVFSYGRGRSGDTEQECQAIRPIAWRLRCGRDLTSPPVAENHWKNVWIQNPLPLSEDGYKLLVYMPNTV